jgi:hypothetical protein
MASFNDEVVTNGVITNGPLQPSSPQVAQSRGWDDDEVLRLVTYLWSESRDVWLADRASSGPGGRGASGGPNLAAGDDRMSDEYISDDCVIDALSWMAGAVMSGSCHCVNDGNDCGMRVRAEARSGARKARLDGESGLQAHHNSLTRP